MSRQLDTIAHNMANVNTAGFKKTQSSFSKIMDARMQGKSGIEDIKHDQSLDFSQGNVVADERPLNFALVGEGFFVVESPQGPRYTRSGVFGLNTNGQIVDSEGRIVSGTQGPITIPEGVTKNDITVTLDGVVKAAGTELGQMKVVHFDGKEHELKPAGDSAFMAPKGLTARPAENTVVKQGHHETSNVEMVRELVSMIMVSRLYESNLKVIEAKGQTTSSLLGLAKTP